MPRHNDPAPSYDELFQTDASTFVSANSQAHHDIESRATCDCDCDDGASDIIPTSTRPLEPSVFELDPLAPDTPSGSGTAFDSQKHSHCEVCEAKEIRRLRQNHKRMCCTLTALTFMLLIICIMVVALEAVSHIS